MTREEAVARIKDHIEIHRYHERNAVKIFEAFEMAIQALEAQPETHDKRTETHACDLISRQAAIEINQSYHGQMPNEVNHRIWKEINELPPAQPEPEKYEYHYDHTDCIWYRPEARNRCPVTCAQYRDGWNDAMNYIFRDGKGYRPYRREKQYGE